MLREQVITPRAGRGGAAGRARNAGGAQRPAARRSGGGNATATRTPARGQTWHKLRPWLPLTGKVLLAVCAGVLVFRLYHAASASTFFALRTVDVSGASRASAEQLKTVVRHAAGPVGVWRADLDAIRTELERQPWVRSAAVARVLPTGLRVRITERVPRVVVRTSAGRLAWADDDGVLVGTLSATDQMPPFFMRGWDDDDAPPARAANRQRVAQFLTLQSEWTAAGLAERVSEVNLNDARDVRAQLAGDDARIEVRLGKDDLTKRLRLALQTLDEQRQTPRGALVSYIDMTQGRRAVVGFTRTAAAASDDDSAADVAPAATATAAPARTAEHTQTRPATGRAAAAAAAANDPAAPATTHAGTARKNAAANNEPPAADSPRGTEQRPRRVGQAN